MLGSIIGDLAGSIYEYSQITNCQPVKMERLIKENSFFSDDTILTVAVADAVLNGKDYGETLRQYTKDFANYLPKFSPYFASIFSPNFLEWAISNETGESLGNGAMMRVAPVGFLFDTEADVIKNAKLATIPSHNSVEAISCATIIALIILYFRQGKTKEEVVARLKLNIVKPAITKFNLTCEQTLPIYLYSIFASSSFENAISLALSFGGDTDTNACIVGGMAQALYGIDATLKRQAMSKLPKKFQTIINEFYKKIKK